MKMTSQSQLYYLIVVAVVVYIQILAPKCSAAKTQEMLDSIMDFLRGRPNVKYIQQLPRKQKLNSTFSVESPEEVVKMVQK